jgi:hypothetical protein
MPGRAVAVNPRVARRAGCGCVLGFVVAFGGFMWFVLFSNSGAKMMGAETYPLKSDPKHFDPFAGLAEVRERVGKNAHLIEISAYYVRSDGTMDLEATYKPSPNVTYTFQVPVDKPPSDAPPVGVGSTTRDSVWLQEVEVECYQPGQGRSVSRSSGGTRVSYSYHNEGMDFSRHSPAMQPFKDDIGDPKITTVALWKIALDKGAPKDAVAIINDSGTGYRFNISAAKIFFTCDVAGHLSP